MKKLIFPAASFLLLTQVLVAQPFGSNNAFNKPPVNIMSPDAASLGKYGTYNVNHYTGTPNISVPIYEIKESGVSIPISLSYDASGFIPNKNSNQVGHNWNLTAGGVITRTVKGVPDEKRDPNWQSSPLPDQFSKDHTGYIYGINHTPPNQYPTQPYLESLSFLASSFNNIVGFPGSSLPSEYNPDIFSFNFLGHSGTFVMGNDGAVKVNSDRRYKVDLSGLKDQFDLGASVSLQAERYFQQWPENITNYLFSSITITSDDGYVFSFGGKLQTLEMSFSYPGKDYRGVIGTSGVISAWYLTKVVAPDGDQINFDYGSYTPNEIKALQYINSENHGVWETAPYALNFMDVRLVTSDYKQEWSLYNNQGYSYGITTQKSLIKMAYLKSFQTKSKTVSFIYSPKNESSSNKFYASSPYYGYANHNVYYFTSKIDRITIADRIGIARPMEQGEFLASPKIDYDFTYEYYGNSSVGYRLFLTQIKSDNIQYNFDYSRTSELPDPMTAGIDKWGFYNGENGNTWLIGINGTPYGDPAEFETNFTYSGQVRTANASKADIGLLQKITYPTKGTTEFEFEAHRYKKVLKRKVNPSGGNSMIPEWVTLNPADDDVAGGCRIKTITSYPDPNSPAIVTNYKYIKDYNQNPNGPSSGLLTEYGVFRVRLQRTNGQYHETLYDQNIAKANAISESHICYSQVVEVSGSSNEGYTKYSFTNPDNQEFSEPQAAPDNYFLGSNAIRIWATFENITSLANQMKRLARYSSRATERGKLWKKEVYANGNNLLQSSEYEYNRDNNRFDEKTVGYEKIYNQAYPEETAYNGIAFFFNSFHIYHYHNNPSKITEKTFANGQTLTQVSNFIYKGNSNPLLTEKTVTKSDGSVYKNKYFYPEDRIGDPEYPASSGMVTRNMVGTVIEEQTYKDATLLQTQKFIYGDATGNQGYKLVNTKSIDYTLNPSTTEQWMNISYYTDGNVKQSYKLNDIKTSYIWDYKKSLPVAEVKNVEDPADIAFTSFETDENWPQGIGYNQWVYNLAARVLTFQCPTGSKAYDLNYNATPQTITRSLNPAKQYVLSLWFNGTSISVGGLNPVSEFTIGSWTYKEYAVTGLSSITISGTGTGKVDELRLYPKGSFMTTYTYQPLFGLTSQCDVNNRISYYAYDNSGRLVLVKDKDRNIIKKICYNYAGQAENCTPTLFYKNTPLYQVFTKNDCPEGYEGGSVLYLIEANTYGSDFSEIDANHKAQSDVSFNGQAYANANGTCNCTTNSCSGVDKKCINGVCETGVRRNISSTYSKGSWICVYVYEWSDCSHSQQYSEAGTSSCTIQGTCGD